jgi:MFS family permease
MPMPKNSNSIYFYGALVCAMSGLFYAYEFLLRILPGALQSELMQAFGHISAGQFGQMAALYYFAYSPMQLPVGLLMDRFGPRIVLTISCLFCALGSWLFAQTDHLYLAGLGRFLVGLGSSFAFVGMLFLGHHWLPRKFFSLLAGLVTTFAMLTLMFGVVKITQVAQLVGLTAIFKTLVVFGFILSILTYLVVKDSPDGQHVLHQQPLKHFFKEVWSVLVSPNIWLVGLIGAALYTALSVFGELWGKAYLEQAHHLSSIEAAKAISAIFFGWAVGAPLVGYFSDHSGYRILPLFLGAACALLCISAVLYVPHLSWWSLTLLLFFYGVFTSAEIIVFVMGKEMSEANLSGTVFASVNMIVMLGGMILQPLVGYLLDWSNQASGQYVAGMPHVYTVLDYQRALSVLPGSMLLVMVLLIYLWVRQHHACTPR